MSNEVYAVALEDDRCWDLVFPTCSFLCVLHPMESKVRLRCSSKIKTLAPLVSVSVICVCCDTKD